MWVIGGLTLVVLLGTVLAAMLLEPAPVPTAGPVVPRVTGPDDLRAARPPLRMVGYDPGTVDALLAQAATLLESSAPAGAGQRASGEELEDGGGDGAGVLDGGPVADVGEDGHPADRD